MAIKVRYSISRGYWLGVTATFRRNGHFNVRASRSTAGPTTLSLVTPKRVSTSVLTGPAALFVSPLQRLIKARMISTRAASSRVHYRGGPLHGAPLVIFPLHYRVYCKG